MEKLKMHTPNLADENYKKLVALFPNAVTESIDDEGNVVRAIDKDVLMQEINTTVVDDGQERYQFIWPDKRKAIMLANQPIAKTLRLDREKSVSRDGTLGGDINSENIYIEGDNLDALKLLQETYLGKVKMIYIDPPYNTGSDFIYEDNFSQSVADYANNGGQVDEDGNRMVQNSDNNGRFHTDWLNMIYPRLKIAKDFLTDDGVIFISINDYELDNLYKVCNEIFGKNHYLGTIVWKARVKPVNIGEAKFKPQKEIEYILCYEKTAYSKFYPIYTGTKRSYPYEINGRKYRTATILKSNRGGSYRTTMSFSLNGFKPKEGQRWQAGESEIKRLWKEGYIEFKEGVPFRRYFNDEEGAEHSPFYCFMNGEWSSTSEAGKDELNELLGEFHGFDTVKPVALLKTLIMSCTQKNDIVMDFFSGSSTMSHALMKLNSEMKSNRSFINIQIPEKCSGTSLVNKRTVKNLCEIGEERIRCAGKKIKEETSADIDYGFRCFYVDSSNMKDVYYSPAKISQDSLELFEDNIKENRTSEDLLIQVMLDLGVLLSSKIEQTEIAGKNVFSVADGYLIACFDQDVTEDVVTAIAKKHPFYAVFRDSSMANDSVAANFEQIFETYSPETVRKVL